MLSIGLIKVTTRKPDDNDSNADGELALSVSGNHFVRVFDCDVSAHVSCDPSKCEVKRLLSKIGEGQIEITIFSAKLSLLFSFVMAGTAFLFHMWCSTHAVVFSVEWWEVAIIMAPFGGAAALRIKELIPWKVEERNND